MHSPLIGVFYLLKFDHVTNKEKKKED